MTGPALPAEFQSRLDRLGNDLTGDPRAALLEALEWLAAGLTGKLDRGAVADREAWRVAIHFIAEVLKVVEAAKLTPAALPPTARTDDLSTEAKALLGRLSPESAFEARLQAIAEASKFPCGQVFAAMKHLAEPVPKPSEKSLGIRKRAYALYAAAEPVFVRMAGDASVRSLGVVMFDHIFAAEACRWDNRRPLFIKALRASLSLYRDDLCHRFLDNGLRWARLWEEINAGDQDLDYNVNVVMAYYEYVFATTLELLAP